METGLLYERVNFVIQCPLSFVRCLRKLRLLTTSKFNLHRLFRPATRDL